MSSSRVTETARAHLARVVTERMGMHLLSNNTSTHPREFYDLCLSLSRCIDYAVANGELLPVVQDLPHLLKKISLGNYDAHLRAAIMVLMISAKTACKVGWFSDKEKAELLAVADEVGNCFCNREDIITQPISSPSVPEIMGRFFPLMKMGQIIASMDIKPGYGAYMADFHISKKTNNSPQEKIHLFVAQIDNTRTSACLVSPQLANFLVNGKAVERRTNAYMDPGPQMPTIITRMLKYGTNLLQALGQFNGHYVIIVAYMSMTSSTDISLIQDYVQPSIAAADLDSDLIEGPSRISLNCPISFSRLKTPVKGCACKHHQCFDFSNFVAINSKRPSWRCPHCNQHVCYLDIRIDQNVAKVLKEVGTDVTAVTISDNGSWRAVESNFKEKDKQNIIQKEGAAAKVSNGPPETLPDVLDLTDDDMMCEADTFNIEDRKPSHANLQNPSVTCTPILYTQSSTASGINQNVRGRIGDAFYPGVHIGHGSATLSDRPNEMANMLESMPANSTTPLIADTVSTISNPEAMEYGNFGLVSSVMRNQLTDSLQLHQFHFPNSVFRNEHGMMSSVPRNVNWDSVPVQAFPACPQMPNLQQSSRMNQSSQIPSGSSLFSQAASSMLSSADGLCSVNSNLGRQQQLSMSDMNSFLGISGTSSTIPQHLIQSLGQQSSPVVPNPGMYRTPGLFTDFSNLHLQQTLNGWVPTSLPLNTMTSSQHCQLNGRQSHTVPVATQSSMGGPTTLVGTDGLSTSGEQRRNLGNMVSELNWRPAGRMRGALSGEAYAAALKQLILTSSQPSDTAEPSSQSSVPPAFSPHTQ